MIIPLANAIFDNTINIKHYFNEKKKRGTCEIENLIFQKPNSKIFPVLKLKEKILDGTFLEVGGCDGILYSNTKTLEDHF